MFRLGIKNNRFVSYENPPLHILNILTAATSIYFLLQLPKRVL